MTRRRTSQDYRWTLLSMESADSLIEVLASVVILGIFIIVAYTSMHSVEAWIGSDAEREQAFTYAKQGVQLVRTDALEAYQRHAPAPIVTPPTLPAVRGVQYTESIQGPTSPQWISGTSLTMNKWTITVSWNDSILHGHHVVLTVVADPQVTSSSGG